VTFLARQATVSGGNALVALLAAISAQNLLATNIMVPALSAIGDELGASAATLKLTLTLFFITYAGSLLAYGPLSDRYGRRPVLICSLIIYCTGSVVCATSASAAALISGRMIQGLGAGGGTIIAWAAARDCFAGPVLLRTTSLINTGRSIVPAIAPAAGGVIVDCYGWRYTFGAAGVLGGLMLGSTLVFLPETLRSAAKAEAFESVICTYLLLLKSLRFLAFALAAAFSLGAWFAFIAGSPTLFMQRLGLSPTEFGLCPTLIASGSVLGGFVTARLANAALGSNRLAYLGFATLLLGAAGTLAVIALDITSVASIVVPMFAVSFGCGIVFPLMAANAMTLSAERAGTGFSLIGFLTMVVAAVSTALTTANPRHAAQVFAVVMVGSATASIAGYWFAIHPSHSQPSARAGASIMPTSDRH